MTDSVVTTRDRIRAVALELFARQGYEKTSLREIAERLNVTKAALYYHFRSKEAIVDSLIEDFLDDVDAILAWGKTQSRTPDTRRELVRRYGEVIAGRAAELVCLLQESGPSLRDLAIGEKIRRELRGLGDLLADPDDPLPRQLKHRMAIFAMHFSAVALRDSPHPARQRHAAAVEVALELVSD